MLIHQFAEMADEVLKEGFRRDMLRQALREFRESSVAFDFQDVTPIPDDEWRDLQGFTIELMNNDMFDTPYPACALCYQADDFDRMIMISKFDRKEFFGKASGDYEVVYGERTRAGNIPISIISAGIYVGYPPKDVLEYLPGKNKASIVIRDIHYIDAGVQASFSQKEFANGMAEQIFQNIAALLGLLNARGVTLVDQPAPEKLNKARARKGLHPISASKKVLIRVGDRRVSVSGHSGSHASPRMHWRRGHVRRLESGKIVKVRPHLVGNIGQAAKPDYSVVRVSP